MTVMQGNCEVGLLCESEVVTNLYSSLEKIRPCLTAGTRKQSVSLQYILCLQDAF